MNSTWQELTKYLCHKTVAAGKILAIEDAKHTSLIVDGGASQPLRVIIHRDEEHRFERVLGAFRHGDVPQDLGYLVVYEDGYRSWSPSKAFEEGYTKAPDQ